MKFLLHEDGNLCKVRIQGIALGFQAAFKEFGRADKIALKWKANLDAIDLDGEFELWLTDAEARQLATRILNALDSTSNERH